MKLIMYNNIDLAFFENEGILTNLNTGKFISINYTTYYILSKIKEGMDEKDIIISACNDFEVNEERFKKDFDLLISNMIKLEVLRYE